MASSKEWFESVEEARRRARRRLPSSVFSALHAGAEAGTTLADNVGAFRELGLVPRIATGKGGGRPMARAVMGQELALPVLISPTGVQAVHPEGELAVARAAAGAGTAIGLSSFASKPLEQVVAENPRTFFQVYWLGSRERIEAVLERARAAGAVGLIVTVDWSFAHRRDWGSPAIPEKLDLKAMAGLAPQALVRPRWLGSYLRSGALPDLSTPNLEQDGVAPTFFGAYGEWMMTPPPTWEDLAWLREAWGGPFMVKGVTAPDDARRAVEIGATAISVSNHGGNNLDGTPATIRNLPAVVEAVGEEIEVLIDGGIRRGSDVVKALALGARAAMIGRAYLWGLAANGEAGVANVLEIFRAGIEETLNGIGKESIDDLLPEDVLMPEGFTRR
jgi:heme/flavin dehydrogenase (mycofactocin system)